MITLLIAVPLALAFATVAFPKASKYILPIALIFNLVLLFGFLKPGTLVQVGNWPAAYGIALLLDNVNYPFLLFVNILLLAISLTADFKEKHGILLLVLTASLNGLLLTGDFFNSFVFLEIISAIAYILAAEKKNSYAAFKYLIFGAVAGTLYLIGAVTVYVYAGTLNMGYASFIVAPQYMEIAGIFMLLALLIELKVLPLGLWAPDVYSNGSSLTPVVLGTAVTASIFYLFARIFFTITLPVRFELVFILSTISIIVAQLAALKQKNLGRALAYMAIAGASTVVAALSAAVHGEDTLLSAAFFYLFADVVSVFVLFSIFAYLSHKGFKGNTTVGLAFTIASLSIIGLPLTAGFWAKINLLQSLFEMNNLILPAVLLISTVIEAGYLIKWNVELWYKDQEEQEDESYIPFGTQLVVLLLALVLIIVGFMPQLITDKTHSIATSLTDFRTYFDTLLKGGM
ncbi:MAG: proton-conducting transporter membrane subunit [Fervidobacterium sp.]|uniref:Multicomponent Na+:H+ antiporter subunit D n=1 Tax=Fervidobacterium gondwanense DSM 13020 TaxID=1121883 RepID=A0A1M7RWR9_FERGO|nr:proton-conducting transporter membrane subunit [Fervidobacterium gondwanense]UXF00065.1 NADH-ubiquinone oxidoreductase [Fervidobacterium riparium]SHN50725.1 multicomponent Na+:H+ antiporter subunit D [Fervidobacterium gondwanense DSM 13020]